VVLTNGYVGPRVASTVSFVEEGLVRAVIDPGMVASRDRILEPLRGMGVHPDRITDVILTHHHPDHTVNCALFPRARIHDFWAIYEADRWSRRPAEGYRLSPSIRLIETPGHTPQDLTVLAGTEDGVVAFTHLWWNRNGPVKDPLAVDPRSLVRNRRRVLELADRIVPGHGVPFTPSRVGSRRR